MALDTLYAAETPEGIALSLRPAGLVARCLAYLVDLAIRLGLFFVALIGSSFLGGLGAAFLLITYFALEWLYPVVFELTRAGATPGKTMLRLRVVMDTGLPVTPAASVVRNLLRAADFLPGLYAFGTAAMLMRPDFKRLGDMAAGTLVVYSDTVALHGQLPDAAPMAPSRALSPSEQVAIVSWAGRASRLTQPRFEELARLAQSVCSDKPASSGQHGLATERLLGVAQWILGRRAGKTP